MTLINRISVGDSTTCVKAVFDPLLDMIEVYVGDTLLTNMWQREHHVKHAAQAREMVQSVRWSLVDSYGFEEDVAEHHEYMAIQTLDLDLSKVTQQ